nr:Transposon Ty3-G Gag-Pol polyprotein [Ipomoea batatas]
MNAVVQPQVQGILGPSPDTHLQPSMQTENGQGTQRFHIKLELPRFDGSDPHGWVFRIQEYFDFYDTPDTQRLRIAGFTMEGKASEWYQWMKKNRLLTTWKEFLQNVTKRFGESRFEDFQGKLSKLTQQTTVTAYQAEFERLMNKVTGIAEPILLSMFIAGLKPLIRREVQMARPTTLMEAFDLAREYEAKLEEIQAELQPVARSPLRRQQRQIPPANTTRSAQVITQSSVQDKRETTTLALPPSTQSTSNLPIKRLTPAEMREKREKGICYNCDQRWSNNHRCRTRFLMLMGTGDDDIEDPLLQEDTIVHGQDDIISGDISSLNSLAGPGNPRSLKLLGEVNGQKLQILIDSGSTHNFVQPKIAEQLQLHALKVTPFRVYVGNGDSLACSHSCKQVPLTLHGTEFLIDFFVLPIRGSDMVLGIQWLRGLGKVEHDYANMSMQFEWKGQQVKLQGNHSLTPQEITLNQLEAPVATREILELYELFLISGPESPPEENNTEKSIQEIQLPTDIPPEIITILQQHEKLFQAPVTLPPYRFFNHRIHLQPGTKPINVHPYRYPHFQKEEIEKLFLSSTRCSEMSDKKRNDTSDAFRRVELEIISNKTPLLDSALTLSLPTSREFIGVGLVHVFSSTRCSEMSDKKRNDTSDDSQKELEINLKGKNPNEDMTIESFNEEKEYFDLLIKNQKLMMENIQLKENITPLICSDCKMINDLLAQNFKLKQEVIFFIYISL